MRISLLPRRRGASPSGFPATLQVDLDETRAHNAELAARLVQTQQYVDRANQALADLGEEMRKAHSRMRAENTELRRDRDGLRKQLDDALGYGPTELAAIASGKGEPLVRGAGA